MPAKKQSRQCQPCSACCDGWVQTTIGGISVYPGRPCPHSTGEGCDDYAARPQDPCVTFNCGWIIADSPLPDWMKPCRARVIVLFGKTRWGPHPVDLAVPVGARIPPRALNWLKGFAERESRPLLFLQQTRNGVLEREQSVGAHGPPAFRKYIHDLLASGKALW